MKLKKYITLVLTAIAVSSLLIGCSSREDKEYKDAERIVDEITPKLNENIEKEIKQRAKEYNKGDYTNFKEGQCEMCGSSSLVTSVHPKGKATKVCPNCLGELSGMDIKQSTKEENKQDIEQKVQDSQTDNTQETTQDTEEIEPRGGFGYCSLCNESYPQYELTTTNLNGEKVTVCPNCLEDINSGMYDNVDMNNAN